MKELAKHLNLLYGVFYPNNAYDIKALAVMLNPVKGNYEHANHITFEAIWSLIKSRYE
jgi:hypothetical protein